MTNDPTGYSTTAVYGIIHGAVMSALEAGAPGIHAPARHAIATNAALKATSRINALQSEPVEPTAPTA